MSTPSLFSSAHQPDSPIFATDGPAAAHTFLNSVFQPIFNLHHSGTFGTEALLQASRFDGTPIPPDLMFAGRSPSDTAALDRHCHRTHLRNARGVVCASERLFLNAAPATLLDERHVNDLVEAVVEVGMHPQQIVIEVLEHESEPIQLGRAVAMYRQREFAVAVDNFGSGASNIDRVACLAPDFVKLDRSWIESAPRNKTVARRLREITAQLHGEGCFVIVEGIETSEQLGLAIEAHVDLAQGFFLARPAQLRITSAFVGKAIDKARAAAESRLLARGSGFRIRAHGRAAGRVQAVI